MKQDTKKICKDMHHDFRLAWKELVLADLVYKTIAFAVLTPLVGLILRLTLSVSGTEVLADQDILRFLLGPVGWITFVVVMSVGISVIVFEQAVLIIVVAGAAQEQRVSVRRALAHTLPLTWPVLQVVGRLLVVVLATVAPFLLAMGAVYFLLLGQMVKLREVKLWTLAWLADSLGLAAVFVHAYAEIPAVGHRIVAVDAEPDPAAGA